MARELETRKRVLSAPLTELTHSLDMRRELIDRTVWTDDLSGDDVQTLAKYTRVYSAAQGSVIFREGDREAFMSLIVEGRVDITKKGSNNAAKRIHTAGPGRTFGEMSLIDGEPRSALVVAVEPTTLVVLSQQDFARLADEVPRLAVRLLLKIGKLISQRLRQTSGVLVDCLVD